MDTVLGLLGVAVFIPIVVSMAAGITWIVVKVSPPPDGAQPAKTQRSS